MSGIVSGHIHTCACALKAQTQSVWGRAEGLQKFADKTPAMPHSLHARRTSSISWSTPAAAAAAHHRQHTQGQLLCQTVVQENSVGDVVEGENGWKLTVPRLTAQRCTCDPPCLRPQHPNCFTCLNFTWQHCWAYLVWMLAVLEMECLTHDFINWFHSFFFWTSYHTDRNINSHKIPASCILS